MTKSRRVFLLSVFISVLFSSVQALSQLNSTDLSIQILVERMFPDFSNKDREAAETVVKRKFNPEYNLLHLVRPERGVRTFVVALEPHSIRAAESVLGDTFMFHGSIEEGINLSRRRLSTILVAGELKDLVWLAQHDFVHSVDMGQSYETYRARSLKPFSAPNFICRNLL
jgi:hypothetical protein